MTDDGRWAITADYDHNLYVWDLDRAVDAAPLPELDSWRGGVFEGFSADCRYAMLAVGDGGYLLCDCQTGELATTRRKVRMASARPPTLAGHAVTSSRIDEPRSPTGRRAKRSGAKKGPDLDARVGDLERTRGHTARVRAQSSSPDGRWDLTVSADGTARLWDLERARPLATFSGDAPFTDCRWSPDGSTVAVLHFGGVHVLRLEGAGRS
jgi:WD40 repeat protein